MRWRGRRQSSNVEDRRLSSGRVAGGAAAGGGIGMVILIIIVMLMGGDPKPLLDQTRANQQNQGQAQATDLDRELTAAEVEAGEFAATVLGYSEEVWTNIFNSDRGLRANRISYKKPKMVLFAGQTQSACGFASAASGPFYCPGDEMVYLDTSFFDQLSRDLGAPGDFAQAYVIAHEVGHHVQNLLGATDAVDQIRRTRPDEYNQYSVRLELQADFYAGVMLHHANKKYKIIEPGDIREAMNAAQAIGDDTLQRRSQGYVVPESFNHGTSEQRLKWLMKGLETGDINQGDTFSTRSL